MKENDDNGAKAGSPLVRRIVWLAAAVALAALSAYLAGKYLARRAEPVGAGPAMYADQMYIDPDNADLVMEGREVYEANCANCHGHSLEGQPNWRERGPDGILPAPPHDETGHTWHHPDAVLFATVKSGGQLFMPQGMQSGMPGFDGILSDRQIEASIAYIKSHWPSEIRRRQLMLNMQSQPPREK